VLERSRPSTIARAHVHGVAAFGDDSGHPDEVERFVCVLQGGLSGQVPADGGVEVALSVVMQLDDRLDHVVGQQSSTAAVSSPSASSAAAVTTCDVGRRRRQDGDVDLVSALRMTDRSAAISSSVSVRSASASTNTGSLRSAVATSSRSTLAETARPGSPTTMSDAASAKTIYGRVSFTSRRVRSTRRRRRGWRCPATASRRSRERS